MKTCKTCSKTKDHSDFYKHPKTRDRLQQSCKSCSHFKRSAYGRTPSGKAVIAAACKRPLRIAASLRRQRESRSSVLVRAAHMLSNAKSSAKRAGVAFDLTLDFLVEKLTPMKCEATRLPFDWSKSQLGRVNPRTPSMDRVDEKGGYTMNNVRVVCWQYNLARNTYGDAMLMEMAVAMVGTISSQGR